MWNDDWRYELEKKDYYCFERLCECRNTKTDIFTMTLFMADYNKDKTMEECLDRVLEWVCVWNNQYGLINEFLNYEKILKKLSKKVLTK